MTRTERYANLTGVVVPFVGVLVAIVLRWNRAVDAFQAFPRTGLPRFFAGYADYVEAIDALIASDAVPDPSFMWWESGCSRRSGPSRSA